MHICMDIGIYGSIFFTGGRGSPMKNNPIFSKIEVVFRGGSSCSRLLIWKNPKEIPLGGRISYNQRMYMDI